MTAKRRLRIYVAGAYSASTVMEVFANMRRGITLATRIMEKGFSPFCPWIDYQFALSSEFLTLEDFYAYSMSWLEVSDAVLLVDHENTEKSVGTQKEITRAKELGIPVFKSFDELRSFRAEKEFDDLSVTPKDIMREIDALREKVEKLPQQIFVPDGIPYAPDDIKKIQKKAEKTSALVVQIANEANVSLEYAAIAYEQTQSSIPEAIALCKDPEWLRHTGEKMTLKILQESAGD